MSMYSRHYNDFKEKIAPPLRIAEDCGSLVQQEDSYPSSYVAPVILPEQCIYVFSTMTSIRNISYLILSSVATFYFVKYLMGGAKLTRFGHLAFAI